MAKKRLRKQIAISFKLLILVIFISAAFISIYWETYKPASNTKKTPAITYKRDDSTNKTEALISNSQENLNTITSKPTKPPETKPQEIIPAQTKAQLSIQNLPATTYSALQTNPAIQNTLQKIIDSHPELSIGASFLNLQTGEQAEINGNQLFVAASTIKVLVASCFLNEVQNGKYTLDTPLGDKTAIDHLEKMINDSNNDSWYLFIDLLTWNSLYKYGKSLGLNYVSKENSISAHDMTILLSKLYKRELLNEENTKLLLSYMYKTHDERYIPGSKIPATYYHKTGKLDGYVHDTSIIDDGANKYILTIFTNGKTTWESRIPAFHEITKAAFSTQ